MSRRSIQTGNGLVYLRVSWRVNHGTVLHLRLLLLPMHHLLELLFHLLLHLFGVSGHGALKGRSRLLLILDGLD